MYEVLLTLIGNDLRQNQGKIRHDLGPRTWVQIATDATDLPETSRSGNGVKGAGGGRGKQSGDLTA